MFLGCKFGPLNFNFWRIYAKLAWDPHRAKYQSLPTQILADYHWFEGQIIYHSLHLSESVSLVQPIVNFTYHNASKFVFLCFGHLLNGFFLLSWFWPIFGNSRCMLYSNLFVCPSPSVWYPQFQISCTTTPEIWFFVADLLFIVPKTLTFSPDWAVSGQFDLKYEF